MRARRTANWLRRTTRIGPLNVELAETVRRAITHNKQQHFCRVQRLHFRGKGIKTGRFGIGAHLLIQPGDLREAHLCRVSGRGPSLWRKRAKKVSWSARKSGKKTVVQFNGCCSSTMSPEVIPVKSSERTKFSSINTQNAAQTNPASF